MTDAQRKLTALLIWLEQQGGHVDADARGLDWYSGDFEPVDTINQAFKAGLAEQIQHGDDWFTVRITDAGRAALQAGAQDER